MLDDYEQTGEFALTEAIAAALRDKLGVAIEEQSGFYDPSEAGQVNRAFRIMAGTILRTITRLTRTASTSEPGPGPAGPAAAGGRPARSSRGRLPAQLGAGRP
jgi:hypothetical protein